MPSPTLQCVERGLVPKGHVQLLQWLHGKQQQHLIARNTKNLGGIAPGLLAGGLAVLGLLRVAVLPLDHPRGSVPRCT